MALILISSAAFAVGWYFGRVFKRVPVKELKNRNYEFGENETSFRIADLTFEGQEIELRLTRKEIERGIRREYTNLEDID